METERKFNLTPEEQKAHEESESRRQQVEHERAIKSLEKAAEKTFGEMTPEQITEAEAKRKKAEETRPWGI